MRKRIAALVLVGLLLLAGTQVALATDGAGNGRGNPCFLDLLPEDARLQAEAVLSEFRAKMTALRERIAAYRGTGDREGMGEVREEMWQIKNEVREQIAPLLPEEYRDRYMNREYGRQRHCQPEDRPLKGGWRAGKSAG
jgi:hypothetical protein